MALKQKYLSLAEVPPVWRSQLRHAIGGFLSPLLTLLNHRSTKLAPKGSCPTAWRR